MADKPLTLDGINTFLILAAAEMLRENPEAPTASTELRRRLNEAVETIVTDRDSVQFPLPAKTTDDLGTVRSMMDSLNRLLDDPDMKRIFGKP